MVPYDLTFFMNPINSLLNMGFLGGSVGRETTCNAGDLSSTLGQEEPLEKEMVTHSSILTWKIPWTEEPGGL